MTDNPMAFPCAAISPSDDLFHQEGMSLRDWFAGQSVAAFAAYGAKGHAPAHMVAAAAYELADAMLAERAKGSLHE